MKLRHILTTLTTTILLAICGQAAAQSSRGDKLFLEGQTLQKTMTVASQNKAITKFQQAKVAYTSQDKKSMCDNQIESCRANIRRINEAARAQRTAKAKKEEPEEPQADTVVVEPTRNDVEISFSKTRLDFGYSPSAEETQNVDIMCNYDDWTLDSLPSWVQVYVAPDRKRINVAVTEKNTTGEYRSATVIARCDNKYATLTINQDKKNVGNVIKDRFKGVKGIFKKKKK